MSQPQDPTTTATASRNPHEEAVAPKWRCHLCGVPVPQDGPPLCHECLRDQEEKWDDHRAEQEQARRPF